MACLNGRDTPNGAVIEKEMTVFIVNLIFGNPIEAIQAANLNHYPKVVEMTDYHMPELPVQYRVCDPESAALAMQYAKRATITIIHRNAAAKVAR